MEPTTTPAVAASTPAVSTEGLDKSFSIADLEASKVPKVETPDVAPKADIKELVVESKSDDRDFNPEIAKKLLEKYKGNTEEVLKALWNKDREYGKLQSELNKTKTATKVEPKLEQTKVDPVKEAAQKEETLKSFKRYEKLQEYMHDEILSNGSISDDLKTALRNEGYSDDAIARDVALRKIYLENETKRAQKYTDIPIAELIKFSQQEGNLTDSELNFIQQGIRQAAITGDASFYRVLKIVEDKMKSKQTTPIEHGTVAYNDGSSSDGFKSVRDWTTAKKDPRYGISSQYTQEVNEKFNRSNSENWINDLRGS